MAGVSAAMSSCTVETRNRQHLTELRELLKEQEMQTYDSK
jgi:hypothetical protein